MAKKTKELNISRPNRIRNLTGQNKDFLNDFEGVRKYQVVKVLEMSQKLIENASNTLNENFA
jgi:hypothetical protein